jgi:RNA polymerase sigma-70 factor (ECF subfamily)
LSRTLESSLIEAVALVERCREGDELAWEALVRQYQGQVYAVAFHYMRDVDEARDMAQEIFVRVYERLHAFRGEERFQPWMMSLARNACIDRLRRRKARPPLSDVPADDGWELTAAGPDPEESADTTARRKLFYRALDKMSEHAREIILLKEIQGLKVEEISKMLGVPVGTVKSRCNRARLELATKVRGLDPSYGA